MKDGPGGVCAILRAVYGKETGQATDTNYDDNKKLAAGTSFNRTAGDAFARPCEGARQLKSTGPTLL